MKKMMVLRHHATEYVYFAPSLGRNFAERFTPELTPKQMLRLGVFGGRYMTDCREEFPASWFAHAKLCRDRHDARLNYFGVNASQSLARVAAERLDRPQDPRGWFQWYCRVLHGPAERRRRAADQTLARHPAPRVRHSEELRTGDVECRRKQRQAAMHWAYDTRRI